MLKYLRTFMSNIFISCIAGACHQKLCGKLKFPIYNIIMYFYTTSYI